MGRLSDISVDTIMADLRALTDRDLVVAVQTVAGPLLAELDRRGHTVTLRRATDLGVYVFEAATGGAPATQDRGTREPER